jgi:very-short-patch-repair endonuclease/predicted transcriptional regulator of viral defense system
MRHAIHKTPDMQGICESRAIERAIARIAADQFGLITRVQLHGIGLGDGALEYRLSIGRLHRIHPGVYAVGHRLVAQRGLWLAAVLVSGERAVLSHEAAADLWGLRASRGREIDVTVPVNRRGVEGVRVHRTKLDQTEITKRGPIPVTTPTRTLLDLASQVDERSLERALREAIYLRLTNTASLTRCLSTHKRRSGSKALRHANEGVRIAPGRLRNDFEHDCLTFLRKHKLPLPEFNEEIEGFEVDCVWRAHRLVVELDGGAAHDTPHGFENDRVRDEQLVAAGWSVIRVTPSRLRDQGPTLASHLRGLLEPPR